MGTRCFNGWRGHRAEGAARVSPAWSNGDLAVSVQSPLRILWLVCLVVSVWMPVALGQTVVLSLSSASGTPGSTVFLQMSLAGEAEPAGLQWSMNYPAMDLRFDNAQPGPAAVSAGKSIQCSGETGTTTSGLSR